jgi:hypothetical protein
MRENRTYGSEGGEASPSRPLSAEDLPQAGPALPTMPLRTDSLTAWLSYLESLHPRTIDLGLDRVREVWQRMRAPRPAPICFIVGGTNGKGSTVAFLTAMLEAAGQRVGSYTSPHLLRYNERVRIDGRDASDEELVAAFVAIDTARSDISLSYFEFGTLAAFGPRAVLDWMSRCWRSASVVASMR